MVTGVTEKAWVARLAPYKRPDNRRAVFETAISVIPYLVSWFIVWAALQISFLLAVIAAIPAAGFMLRLFIIQHDCGHYALFSSRATNDWVGRVMGVFTLTPYDYWRHSHALHHASSGNLDKRGFGDIDTLTVEEYLELSPFEQLKYRLYRHPVVLFIIGPAYLFIVRHRMPYGAWKKGRTAWIGILATNLGIVAVYGLMIYLVGLHDFILTQLPIVVIGASLGVWFFYVQHQFDPTHWDRAQDWKREVSALYGSSYYDLPKPLMWMTGYIGIHHVHHLSSNVPFHRLPRIIRDYPELKDIGRLTFWQSLKCIPLALWDESSRRLISFRELGRRTGSHVAA